VGGKRFKKVRERKLSHLLKRLLVLINTFYVVKIKLQF